MPFNIVVPSSRSSLRRVVDQSAWNLDIIVIPDITPKTSPTASLYSLLRTVATNSRIFEFENTCQVNKPDISVWQSLNDEGDKLLEVIGEELGNAVPSRPLVLIGYGFGGTILKRALVGLHGSLLNSTFHVLQRALSAIVFLGVPHPTYEHRDRWQQLTRILRTCTNIKEKSVLTAESEASVVANVSSKFEDLGIDIPVLSVSEEKETKVKSSRFGFVPKKALLLGQWFAETSVTNEIPICLPCDYFGIGKIEQRSLLSSEISNIIQLALNRVIIDAQHLASVGTGSFTAIHPKTFAWGTESDRSVEDPQEPGVSPAIVLHGSTDISSYDLIPRIEEFIGNRKTPKMPLQLRVPCGRNSNFVGREDVIKMIDEALLPSESSKGESELRTFALCGFGGIGKTQIAIHYAFERRNKFDAIFWIQADEATKLAKSFEQIAQDLDLVEEGESTNQVANVNLALEWLSNPRKISSAQPTGETPSSFPNATWLLIFDNADNLGLIGKYWPVAAVNGAILITTRDPWAKTKTKVGVDLKPLSLDNCTKFLLMLCEEQRTPQSEAASMTLAKKLGCVPLAIRQIAACISRLEMTIEEFLSTEGSGPLLAQLQKVEGMPPQDQYALTISTVWRFESFNEQALSLINMLSIMDPDGIAESILCQADGQKNIRTYPNASQYIDARTELIKTSLIVRDKEEKQLSLHRIVQDVARHHMDSDTLQAYFALAVELLFRAWPRSKDSKNREKLKVADSDKVHPHLSRIRELYMTNPKWDLAMSLKRQFVVLLEKVAWYLVQRIEHQAAEPMLTTALSICEADPEKMADLLSDTLFSLARYGEEINMAPQKLWDYSQRHLKLCEKLNDGSPDKLADLATAHTGLAQGYLLLDNYSEAVRECQLCMDIDPEVVAGREVGQFASIYKAWGHHGLGQNDEAALLLDSVIEYRKKQYGPDDINSTKLGYALHALGNVRAKQGLHQKSFDAYTKALANFRATTGNSYFRTGSVCLKLAEHHINNGQPEIASVYLDQALKIFRQNSHYKPELARALFKKARFAETLNSDAEGAYDQARALYKEIVPTYTGHDVLTEHEFDSIVRFWSR